MPKAIDPLLSFEEKTDLGIREAADIPPQDHLFSVVFLQITHRAKSVNPPNDSNLLQSNTDRKKDHQFSVICGNNRSFTNKTEFSGIDVIDPKHEQESRQPP